MRPHKLWLCLAIFFSVPLTDNWSAEPEVRFNLLTLPGSRQADLRLAMPARLNYRHAPLRLCVSQLAEHFQFSYWIDRRIDADKHITLELNNASLRECLDQLASACDCEVGLVENVVTFARSADLAAMQYAALRLHNQLSLVQASAQAPEGNKQKSADALLKPLSWPMLTTPTELAQSIKRQWQLAVAIELPHDLMNEGMLQPCTVSTQLTLLLAGFDRCAAGSRLSELRVVPMPKPGNWQAEYSSSQIVAEQVSSVKAAFGAARIEKAGSTWTVVGPTAAHLRLLQKNSAAASTTTRNTSPSRGGKAGSDPLSSMRFDISKQVDKPLGAILKNLGDQLGLMVEWDPALSPSAPHSLVTIEARKAKLDEVLANLAEQAQLSIQRTGTRILVTKE